MTYTRHYAGMPPAQADAKAIADAKEYLGPKAWEALLYELGRANEYGLEGWKDIMRALAFIGIQGLPVHALGRAYCLAGFREWMHSGDKPVMTDEKGYPL